MLNPRKFLVTVVGTLPPLKGISYYCLNFCQALSKIVNIQFIGFKKIYPERFYPHGTESKLKFDVDASTFSEIKNIINYNNPCTWVKAALYVRGKILHIQYWAYPLVGVNFIIMLLNKFRRKKIVVTLHNVLPHENKIIGWAATLIMVLLADKLIVHDKRIFRNVVRIYPVRPNKVNIIPHGLLLPICRSNITREKARMKLNLGLEELVILFFGNIREYKGLDVMLYSLRKIRQHLPHVRLLIAGAPWHTFSFYETLIKMLKLEGVIVKNLKYIPDEEVETYFVASDIVVLPYKFLDSSSGVAALAIGFNKPLVVTDVGGLNEFVLDKNAIAQPNDPEDLAQKIIRILTNEELRKKLILDSVYVKKKISWEAIGEKTLKLYHQLMKNKINSRMLS
ncbi:MAG: glycosyltransferase [Candidatus Bathyarchaeia archaeon]